MCGTFDEHLDVDGAGPICAVPQIAPPAYNRHAARCRDQTSLIQKAQRDAAQTPAVEQDGNAKPQVYGADKVCKQMNRDGIEVVRSTVERWMQRLGMHGARRGKMVRPKLSNNKASCPPDKVNRQFRAERCSQL